MTFEQLEKRVLALEQRNARVEADKAWETSWARKILIGFLTYGTVVVFMFGIEAPNPWLSSCVPVLGYILSTLVVSPLKKLWIDRKIKL